MFYSLYIYDTSDSDIKHNYVMVMMIICISDLSNAPCLIRPRLFYVILLNTTLLCSDNDNEHNNDNNHNDSINTNDNDNNHNHMTLITIINW